MGGSCELKWGTAVWEEEWPVQRPCGRVCMAGRGTGRLFLEQGGVEGGRVPSGRASWALFGPHPMLEEPLHGEGAPGARLGVGLVTQVPARRDQEDSRSVLTRSCRDFRTGAGGQGRSWGLARQPAIGVACRVGCPGGVRHDAGRDKNDDAGVGQTWARVGGAQGSFQTLPSRPGGRGPGLNAPSQGSARVHSPDRGHI